MNFIEQMKEKAKQNIKTIVLPEASDIRTLRAAATALAEGYADVVLLGNSEEIIRMAQENNLDLSKSTMIDPKTSDKAEIK